MNFSDDHLVIIIIIIKQSNYTIIDLNFSTLCKQFYRTLLFRRKCDFDDTHNLLLHIIFNEFWFKKFIKVSHIMYHDLISFLLSLTLFDEKSKVSEVSLIFRALMDLNEIYEYTK
jgi:hypothetical protein